MKSYQIFQNTRDSVQSPGINGTMVLVSSSATELRTRKLRNSVKCPEELQHRVIQQEAPTIKLDHVDDRHLSCNFKYRRIPVIVNGLVNLHGLESDRKSINCNKILNLQKIFGNSAVKKDVKKGVIFGDSHSRGLSAKVKDKLLNSFEVIGYTKPNCKSPTLLSMGNQDRVNLTKKDVLVLVAGMNDAVSENCVKELGYISQFVKSMITQILYY
jgi:hypothetical protein